MPKVQAEAPTPRKVSKFSTYKAPTRDPDVQPLPALITTPHRIVKAETGLFSTKRPSCEVTLEKSSPPFWSCPGWSVSGAILMGGSLPEEGGPTLNVGSTDSEDWGPRLNFLNKAFFF